MVNGDGGHCFSISADGWPTHKPGKIQGRIAYIKEALKQLRRSLVLPALNCPTDSLNYTHEAPLLFYLWCTANSLLAGRDHLLHHGFKLMLLVLVENRPLAQVVGGCLIPELLFQSSERLVGRHYLKRVRLRVDQQPRQLSLVLLNLRLNLHILAVPVLLQRLNLLRLLRTEIQFLPVKPSPLLGEAGSSIAHNGARSKG